MNKIINRLFVNLKYHQTMVNLLVALLFFASLALGLIYFQMQGQLHTHYLRIFEKKSWSELQMYHKQSLVLAEYFFDARLEHLEGISSGVTLKKDLETGNFTSAKQILVFQGKTGETFNALGVLDKNGRLILSTSEVAEKFVGENLGDRHYFKGVVKTKKPYIGELIKTISGTTAVVFAAPILDADGNVQFVVTGSVLLSEFAKSLNFNNDFAQLYTILIDHEGILLIGRDGEVDEFIDAGKNDRMVGQLVNGQKEISDEEVNLYGEKAYAMGSQLELADNNKIYMVSFYPKSQFEKELNSFKVELDRIYTLLIFEVFIIVLIFYTIVVWIIRRHERLVAGRKSPEQHDEI